MRFCTPHWTKLREAIDSRGLTPFIAKDGKVATKQLIKQLEDQDVTKATFDPLMSAHWAIAGNTMSLIDQTGNNPLYLLAGEEAPEDPVKGYPGFESRTWPRCPLCYINLAHEVSCTNPKCMLDKQHGYDWMIERAADDALARAREFGLIA
jgi:hypothetical protein